MEDKDKKGNHILKRLNLLFIISIIFFLFLVVFTKRTYSISFETPATSIGSTGLTVRGLAIGDLDSDGNRDVVSLTYGRSVYIWRNPLDDICRKRSEN